MEDKPLCYTYEFHKGENTAVFQVKLNKETLEQMPDTDSIPPDWALLEHHQCSICPFSKDTTKYCPTTAAIAKVVEQFKNISSTETIEVTITTPERRISALTSVQEAASPLIGLLMATSECPHTFFLRPLARFHSPLVSEEENLFRTVSMYMFAQYYRANRRLPVDTEMQGLVEKFRNMNKINMHLSNRIRSATAKDGSLNALVLLDLLAQAIPYVIGDKMQELEYLFNYYLSDDKIQ